MKNDVAIIIPAYNPDENLNKLIKDLEENKYVKIIVINDGSEKTEIFKQIEESVTILEHKKNQGKGRAIKTGINYCLENFNDIIGAITVDADGQHLIEDVNKIYNALENNRNSIILGSRDFKSKQIPFRSKIGNIIFSKILKRKTGIKISDTQTGLRGIPIKYLNDFKEIRGERFEYETNVILNCIEKGINIIEVRIQSIYINKNKSSHYRIIKDSIKICASTLGFKKY